MSETQVSGSREKELNQTTDLSDKNWNTAMSYGKKNVRWVSDDQSALYVQEDPDGYVVGYREGRFGVSDELGQFDNEIDAILEAGRAMTDPENLGDIL